jgi:hypothetical protein
MNPKNFMWSFSLSHGSFAVKTAMGVGDVSAIINDCSRFGGGACRWRICLCGGPDGGPGPEL